MRTGISLLDLKLGLRMLRKHPDLTLVGGIGMAVAIAMSVGMFAFIQAHVYPQIPLEAGDRIVALENRDVEVNNEERRSLHDFVTWREQLRSVDDLAAFRNVERNLITGEGPPELVKVAEMTASGFRVARVPPLMGRYLVEEDERQGGLPVVVIGHQVWQTRFAGDPAIVGRDIRLGRTVHTVVGVMPEGFVFPMSHQFWTPLRADPAAYQRREGPGIFIFGRLAPGITREQAQAELSAIGQRTSAAFPETHSELRPVIMPYTHSLTDIQGMTLWEISQMQFMMTLLLIVVAFNVAVLVYARTATRRGEIAVRSALGASRRRVVAQLFAEALVLALGAAAVALPLAHFGFRQGSLILEQNGVRPFWVDYGLRPSTVLFTVALAVFAAVIVGVLPALKATGRALQSDLRQLGGGTGMRLGRVWTVLIVAQVALAVAALPAAVNLGWSQIRQATTRPTYAAEHFLAARVVLDAEPTPGAETAASGPFGDRLVELIRRVEAEPDVAGVSFRASLPGRGGMVEVEGVPAPAESPSGHRVGSVGTSPNLFDVFGTPVLTGRGFQPGDLGDEATAVVVNRAFVQQVLGGSSALGRRIRHLGAVQDDDGPRQSDAAGETAGPWYQIVGVVENHQQNTMDPELVAPQLFYPVAPAQLQAANLAVRLRGSTPASFAPRLREISVAVDPALRLGTVRPLADADRQMQVAMRLVALVLSLILLTVFLLSAAGVYALMSFTVTQRRREIGIRAALGAHSGQLLRGVFARAAVQIGLGVAVGVGVAALLEGLSGGELLGGRGPILLPAFALAMTVVGLLAALGPARRGLRIQPSEALRADA